MLSQLKTKITPEEYLAAERLSEVRHEFFDGEIFAMAGAARKHNRISSNLVRHIGNQLSGKPCGVYSSDMKVKRESSRKYFYPDVVVSCEKEEFEDEEEDVLLNPILIIEILSDSTEAYDRGAKFFHYQQISSFVEYILVSQKSCHVEKFVRQPDNRWVYSEFHNMADKVTLNSIECVINLQDVYDKV
ncbi:MAG: Uma2 family endonuclease [Gammaproteobacteria bacterium]|nr:Uma2 family endonuclease [Gammaproteobacteria bacterium]